MKCFARMHIGLTQPNCGIIISQCSRRNSIVNMILMIDHWSSYVCMLITCVSFWLCVCALLKCHYNNPNIVGYRSIMKVNHIIDLQTSSSYKRFSKRGQLWLYSIHFTNTRLLLFSADGLILLHFMPHSMHELGNRGIIFYQGSTQKRAYNLTHPQIGGKKSLKCMTIRATWEACVLPAFAFGFVWYLRNFTGIRCRLCTYNTSAARL